VLSRGDLLVFFKHPISCISMIIALMLIFSSLIGPQLKRVFPRSDEAKG
jgi:TctA family transporter